MPFCTIGRQNVISLMSKCARLKVRAGYKKYNDYNKIYFLDPQRSLLAVQALGKYIIRFTI
ncbi:MAG: hypothetical protein WA631_02930, partial [Nitrososphaeraceae archaeon]